MFAQLVTYTTKVNEDRGSARGLEEGVPYHRPYRQQLKKLPYLSCPLGSQNSHANVRDPEKHRQSFKRRNKVKNLLAGFQNLSQSEGNREIWLKEQIYSYKMNKFWGSNAQPYDYR